MAAEPMEISPSGAAAAARPASKTTHPATKTTATTPPTQPSKKRALSGSQSQSSPQSQSQSQAQTSKPKTTTNNKALTLNHPPWSYIHLLQTHQPSQPSTTTTTNPPPLDALTAHLNLTSALAQFLGTHGAAVPIDVLKLRDSEVWIRVPAADRCALVAAVGGWVGRAGEGWRVLGWSSWCAGAEGKEEGRAVFEA